MHNILKDSSSKVGSKFACLILNKKCRELWCMF